MKKIFIELIFLLLNTLSIILKKLFKKHNFLQHIHDKIEKKNYYTILTNEKKIHFFCPSVKTLERVDTFFTKEPETLLWIDRFKNVNRNIIFWDIGSNIGLYSLYAANKINDIEVISFEPSTSNLRVLTRNISINSFSNKIKIFPIALNDEENILSYFEELNFGEGRSRSNFNNNVDQHGKLIDQGKIKNRYQLFGTTIDNLLENKILRIPNYIKIDVDGIEYKILKGANKLFKNTELKEVLVELTPEHKTQYNQIIKFFNDNGFEDITKTDDIFAYHRDRTLKSSGIVNAIFKRV